MDHAAFDHLARRVGAIRSRRAAVAVLGGALVSLPAVFFPNLAAAKKKKKKKVTLCLNGQTITASGKKKKKYLSQGATPGACPPPGCTRKCTGKTCGSDGCGGSCGTCGANHVCQNGACVCVPDRLCGEISCTENVACFAEGCACETTLCSCTGERTFCSTPDFTQCCAAGDTCDPAAACTTDTCTADNDVCTVGGAFCGDGFCLCTTSAAGTPFCGDFDRVEGCPAASACDADTDCGAGETCANVPCCSDTADTFFGVCLAACPVTRGSTAAPADRARMRRQLERTVHRDFSPATRRR